MKSIIVYYSYSGNTKKVAEVLAGYLKDKGEAELISLQALNESNSFFGQSNRALRHIKARIEPAKFDLSGYDLICLGSPVWAFGPAPAMNTYLDACSGIEGKDIILFTTYGSGAGNQRCLNYMRDILSKKGAKQFKQFSIQQFKVKDKEFVLSRIKEIDSL
ncbi:MAG: flavodoxin [Candidatus Omnitrophica bacterium]|nr:flavodoxin [Candidatus Omnitrophota bacterium]MDD5237841.1 flavodoxin [Candidatus Omnitrophota bacterium]